MSKTYDLIVIGSGTAATTVAKRVSAAGRSVAVTDFRPYGGTCALRGCAVRPGACRPCTRTFRIRIAHIEIGVPRQAPYAALMQLYPRVSMLCCTCSW